MISNISQLIHCLKSNSNWTPLMYRKTFHHCLRSYNGNDFLNFPKRYQTLISHHPQITLHLFTHHSMSRTLPPGVICPLEGSFFSNQRRILKTHEFHLPTRISTYEMDSYLFHISL